MQGTCLRRPVGANRIGAKDANASEGQNPLRRDAGQRRCRASCCMAWAARPNVWEPQVRALADRFTLVRFDLEGAGRSPFAGALSIEGWVEDLKAMLEPCRHRQGALRRPLAGHADPAALRGRPSRSRSRSWSSSASTGRRPKRAAQAIRDRVAKVRAEGIDAIVETDRQGRAVAAHPGREARGRRLRSRAADPPERRRLRPVAAKRWPRPWPPTSPASRCRCCCIAGRDDNVSPVANSEGLAADLPNAQLRILEQCGHWHPIEQPAAVSQALREFL